MSVRLNNKHLKARGVLAAAAGAAALGLLCDPADAQVDSFRFYFSSAVGSVGTAAIGGFHYDAANNVFYTAPFQNGFRRVSFSAGWTGTNYVDATDQAFWIRNPDQNIRNTNTAGWSGNSTIGDMAINPATVTIGGITYGPGEVAFIIDQNSVTEQPGAIPRPEYSKLGYFYDLRKSGDPAGGGRDRDGNGTADWNDIFNVTFTLADYRASLGLTGGSVNIARSPRWNTAGDAIYFSDNSSSFGGLWKVDPTQTGTNAISRVLPIAGGTITEPGVLSIATRALDPSGPVSGDQVLVQGASGGIDFFTDSTFGTSVATLLTAEQLLHFRESPGVNIMSIAPDSTNGNIYFTLTTPGGFFVYDAAGNLAKMASGAEQARFDRANGAGSLNLLPLDTKLRDSSYPTGGTGAPFAVRELLFTDASLRSVAGVYLFKPGDFNRDNVVDAADLALFKTKVGLRGANIGSNSADLRFDLNGSTGSGTNTVIAIDWKDVKVFQRYYTLSDADVDMDGSVNTTDLDLLSSNYYSVSGTNGKKWTDGNIASTLWTAPDKDLVNRADLATFVSSWPGAKPDLTSYTGEFGIDIRAHQPPPKASPSRSRLTAPPIHLRFTLLLTSILYCIPNGVLSICLLWHSFGELGNLLYRSPNNTVNPSVQFRPDVLPPAGAG